MKTTFIRTWMETIPKMAWFLVSTFARLYVSIEVMSAFLFRGTWFCRKSCPICYKVTSFGKWPKFLCGAEVLSFNEPRRQQTTKKWLKYIVVLFKRQLLNLPGF